MCDRMSQREGLRFFLFLVSVIFTNYLTTNKTKTLLHLRGTEQDPVLHISLHS